MHTPPPELPKFEHACPNCQAPYDRLPEYCSNCGFNIMRVRNPNLYTGSYAMDIVLALLVCALCVPLLVTTVIPFIWYFGMNKRYIALQNGLRIGMFLYLCLFLGALVVCSIPGIRMDH